ncbi:MAG: hypothetical protein JWR42_57 [Marmoricola sp.]|nr:hypothetical protein [Marmoricola sp.]
MATEPVESTPQPPLLRVVKGDPTPEQLAALVTVVSALAAGAAAADVPPAPRPEWSAHHRAVRPVHRHGPGAWRASAR